MKILVVGAGAVGGYFGARLAAAGRDITFLVRPRRAAQLRSGGLAVISPAGNLHLAQPPLLTAHELQQPFDLILLSCKSYDLEDCLRDIAPAVGPDSRILPLLNGLRHLELLDARFGAQRVFGGATRISATLDDAGRIHHFGDFNTLVYGSREPNAWRDGNPIAAALSGAGFDASLSRNILHDMWEKWVFIAAAASATSFMRGSVGDIVAAGAAGLASGLLQECAEIAAENGFPARAGSMEAWLSILTAADSSFTASMFRDIENKARIEAQHIVGDLLLRTQHKAPLLASAFAHLQTYEARRRREHAARSGQAGGQASG